jgi:hypothetical protein
MRTVTKRALWKCQSMDRSNNLLSVDGWLFKLNEVLAVEFTRQAIGIIQSNDLLNNGWHKL